MDEVFGYFPPSAMPPSKPPLLTLMKQARAFGLGVVLATQNPVDLDYKGLGNAGTWFIGRLQTERDKERVIDGLLGSDASGGLDKAQLEALMANLAQRTFLMRNVHDDAPVLLRTRWALSYLRGPLTLAEIGKLKRTDTVSAVSTGAGSGAAAIAPLASGSGAAVSVTAAAGARAAGSMRTSTARPVLPADVTERFLPAATGATTVQYEPRLGAQVRAHFVDAKAGLDAWETTYYLAPVTGNGADWAAAQSGPAGDFELHDAPVAGAGFANAPASVLSARALKADAKPSRTTSIATATMSLLRCPALKMNSVPGGDEVEFRARVAQTLREQRDDAVDALRRKYAARLATLEDRQRRAEQKIDREREQAGSQTISSALDVGGSLLGALFGGGRRRSSMFGKAATAARSVGRVGQGTRRRGPGRGRRRGTARAVRRPGRGGRVGDSRTRGAVRSCGHADRDGPDQASQDRHLGGPAGARLAACLT